VYAILQQEHNVRRIAGRPRYDFQRGQYPGTVYVHIRETGAPAVIAKKVMEYDSIFPFYGFYISIEISNDTFLLPRHGFAKKYRNKLLITRDTGGMAARYEPRCAVIPIAC
jgi:hypothetical protein